jgi:hypothetical protein
MKSRLPWVIMVALVLIATGPQGTLLALQAHDQPKPAAKHRPHHTSVLTYHDTWRELFEEHISWTRDVIIAVFDDLPGLPQYANRLLQNPGDMADALRPFYGDRAADRFEDLVTEHLTIAVDLLNAAEIGDVAAFEDANERWYENAEDIARLMSKLNPKFWPFDEAEEMWTDHLDATLAEAVAHLTGDFAGEVEAYDKVHDLALEMADFFSNGVIRQFPRRFSGGS